MKLSNSLLGICVLGFFSVASTVHAQTKDYSWENLPKISQPVFKTDTFNVIDFGAKADGKTLNTTSINKAIDDCSVKGGGVVLVPSGYWLTGSIKLKSNVNLHLAKNAFLQFSSDFNQYKIIEGNYEGKPSARNESPIMATDVENIAITGGGIIDGNGDVWRMVGKNKLTENEWKKKIASGGSVSDDGKLWFPSAKTRKAYYEKSSVLLSPTKKLADFEPIKDFLRPNLVVITRCNNILLEGVTFQNSPAWNLHPLMSTNLTMRGLTIKNPDYAQNGDGADIESCKNVLIEDCVFDVGDDAICIKSGKDEEGRKRNMPTENVIIRNNTVYAGHGGFVVGSEMSGGAKNIFVSNCSFIGTDKGIRFKTTRGRGGVVENIYIKDINMSNIVNEAIFFDMYYWVKSPLPNEKVEIPKVSIETPQLKNIEISNIVCNGAEKGVFIRGLPEMAVNNIKMENLFLNVQKGIEITDAKNITIKNANIIATNKKTSFYIENGVNIVLDAVNFEQPEKVSYDINGAPSKNIIIKNSDVPKTSINVVFNHGASEKSLIY